jgi:hypothetical protein
MSRFVFGLSLVLGTIGCSGGDELVPVPSGGTGAAREAHTTTAVENCGPYDSYMASLGELTAQCLGTVDPRAYAVEGGLIKPNFVSCPADPRKLTAIKQVLSLQLRDAQLPDVKACMGGRFAAAQAKFQQSGVTQCPTWTKSRVINPITADTIRLVESGLPSLPAADAGGTLQVASAGLSLRALTMLEADSADPVERLGIFDLLEQNSLYTVAGEIGGQRCASAAECAATCAGAFPSFVVGTVGRDSVVADPMAWLIDATYESAPQDPYLRAGYYHPMSYYGGVPGVVFGDPARAEPCGPGGGCLPELCSYYAGSHLKTRMQMSCVIPGDIDTCASYCGPPLPPK